MRSLIFFGLAFAAALVGCAGKSNLSEVDLLMHEQRRLDEVQSERRQLIMTLAQRIELKHGVAATNRQDRAVLDVLIVSGGGAYGAFGAGFLHAWGRQREAMHSRPQFDLVTGVSTGAMIAPYAFLGSHAVEPCACRIHSRAIDDNEHIVRLYHDIGPDAAVFRGLSGLLPWSDGLYDNAKLKARLDEEICDHLIARLQTASGQRRTLLVGATDADLGQVRIWDLTEIASRPKIEESRRLIRNVLLASAAIPAAFPPVEIDGRLYVDGGAREQLFLGADPLFVRELNAELQVRSIPFPRVRLWVIINNKLTLDPRVTQRGWVQVARRSIENLVNSSTLFSLRDLYYFCENAELDCPDFSFEMRYVCIPEHFAIRQSSEMFDPNVIRELTRLGLKLGADPQSWQTTPPGLFIATDPRGCPPPAIVGADAP